jgi:CspA family cold shock protein
VTAGMPKPRSYDDCVAALERGVRKAALQIVKAIFDAELARLQAKLSEPPSATATTKADARAVASTANALPARPVRSRRRRAPAAAMPRPAESAAPALAAPAAPTRAPQYEDATAAMPANDVDAIAATQPVIAAAIPEESAQSATTVAAAHAPAEPANVALEMGTVKWFSDEKGYGFIAGDDGDDVFVHYKAIRSGRFRTLEAGQRVLFEEREGPRGRFAALVNVARETARTGTHHDLQEQEIPAST